MLDTETAASYLIALGTSCQASLPWPLDGRLTKMCVREYPAQAGVHIAREIHHAACRHASWLFCCLNSSDNAVQGAKPVAVGF